MTRIIAARSPVYEQLSARAAARSAVIQARLAATLPERQAVPVAEPVKMHRRERWLMAQKGERR